MDVHVSRTVYSTQGDGAEDAIDVAVAYVNFHWVCITRTSGSESMAAVPRTLVHYRGTAGMACLIANNLMRHLHAGGWRGDDMTPFDESACTEPAPPVAPIQNVLFV